METKYTFDENIVSDVYKDAYGHRPSEFFWADWNACNDDAKQRLWDALVDAVRESVRDEEARQKKAIEDFETRASFIENAKEGFGRKQFIEYLHDFHKTHGDVEALEFALDVPFGYISGKNWG